MLQYLTESAVWSLGGLFVGYVLGRTEREVREVLKKEEDRNDGGSES